MRRGAIRARSHGEGAMQRRDINAPDAPAPVSAYTQAVEVTGATRTLYISGQVGIDADGNVPDDIVGQSRLAWANLAAQLRAAGMRLDHVVKVVTILPNAADLAASRVARQEALGDRRPASTLIIGGLANPAWKIEVEAVAVA
jgi:enamine deaminase RidA (YjgF/YER057c/UK114 family)